MVRFNLEFQNKKMEEEYCLLKSRSKVENFQVSLISFLCSTIKALLLFWFTFLMSFSITLIIDGQLIAGSLYGGIMLPIALMFFFRKCLKTCNQYLLLIITFMLNLSTLVYAIIEINQGSNSLQLLRGWSFASAQILVVNQFPKFQYKAFFILTWFGLRYGLLGYHDQSIFLPDIIVRNVLTDIFIIYIFFNFEKKERMIFASFYEYRDELLKFKDLLENYLPQSVTILDANTKKSLFSNKAFLNLLDSQLDNKNLTKDMASLQLRVETIRPLDSLEQPKNVSYEEKDINLYLQDLSDSKLLVKKAFSLNASCNFGQDQRKSFEVILKSITWDREEAIAVILNDITYQENILALKVADKNKDTVLATVSHELRTPLNGIIGILQIIQSKLNVPEISEYLSLCKDNAMLLLNLVNSILDLQQIHQKKLKLNVSKVDIGKLLRDTLRLFHFQSTQKKIYLDLEIGKGVPDEIYIDESRVKQILINLIGNALKFTFKGGVTVEVNEEPDDKEFLIIAVKDTGIGIKNEDKSKLFKMYGKLLESESINKNGVGLGLTISDTLAKILNGDIEKGGIELDSKPGFGSKFWFKLSKGSPNQTQKGSVNREAKEGEKDIIPTEYDFVNTSFEERRYINSSSEIQTKIHDHVFRKQVSFDFIRHLPKRTFCLEEDTPEMYKLTTQGNDEKSFLLTKHLSKSSYEIKKLPLQKSSKHKGCLVVDDNSFNLMVAKNFAEVIGYSVKTALNGKEAIEIMKESVITDKVYELILMDCQMPIMDGFEATKILKQMMMDNEVPETPIIALTANNSEEDIQRCYSCGMINHLTKPLLLGDLKKVIFILQKQSF